MPDTPPAPAQSPLAYNKSGEPVQLDPACVAFRVVHANPGTKVAVQARIGGPLYVDLTTSLAELREQTGAGKFVLLQVDDDCHEIEAEPGYLEFGQVKASTGTGSDQEKASKDLLAAVLESNKTLREGQDVLAKALADAVKSLTGNGVKPQAEKAKEVEAEEEEEIDVAALMTKWAPVVQMLRQVLGTPAITDGASAPAAGGNGAAK